jgi:hypothetical protein
VASNENSTKIKHHQTKTRVKSGQKYKENITINLITGASEMEIIIIIKGGVPLSSAGRNIRFGRLIMWVLLKSASFC